MALLTADDVHWKQFQATKFREGYDQDEVDEFLDDVVETIAALQEDNDSLKGQLNEARQAAASGQPLPAEDLETVTQLRAELEAANAQIAQLQQDVQNAQSAVAQPVEGADHSEQVANLQAALARSQAEANDARRAAEQAQAQTQQAVAELNQAQAEKAELEQKSQEATLSDTPEDATSMLSLAQRVHDEYVRNGQEEGDKIVADSRAKGDQIIREANDERQRILDQLAGEQSELESTVENLKTFATDYRTKVADHLRGLLEQVNEGADHL